MSLSSGGVPPFWPFLILLAMVLIGHNVLFPNLNSAAMEPVGHVAGTAAAVYATVTTAAGAIVGSRLDQAFDGTVNPFSLAFAVAGVLALGDGVLAAAARAAAGYVSPMPSALLFDVGDVLMESNWIVLDELERRTGRRFNGRGAVDPAGDPAWQRCLRGEIDIDEYWNQLAQSGGYADRITMWRAMSDELGGGVFAADALALVDEARAAGIMVGILSNDLYRASTREWVASRPEFAKFDVLVDCTDFGERKPAAGAVSQGCRRLRSGTRRDRVSRRHAVLHRGGPGRRHGCGARRPAGPCSRLRTCSPARRARRADHGRSVRRRRRGRLPHPGSVADHAVAAPRHRHLLERRARSPTASTQASRFHAQRLGFGSKPRHDYELRKTLRAADGDTICVEWESSYRTDEGQLVRGRGGEFWTMRYGLLIEWHAYYQRLPDEGGHG